MKKDKSIRFTKKKSSIDKRLRLDYIDHDIATIPCKVDSFYDVIDSYSVKNYETITPEFVEYINNIVDDIPKNYPIVINIVSKELTNEEKSIIEDTILDEYAYDLGRAEKEIKELNRNFILLTIGVILSGILMWKLEFIQDISYELIAILFWFFGESFIECIVFDGRELRKKHVLAARLACCKVVFSSSYDEEDYSKDEKDEIYNEIIKIIKE